MVKLRRMEKCHVVSGFAHRFFEFRGRGRDLVSKRTLRSRFCTCMNNDHYDHQSSMCQFPRFSLFFFISFFVYDQRISSLDLSFSGHCARRRKTEEASTNCREEGLQRMVSHFLDFFWVQRMGSHCYYFVIVLVLVIRSICCCVVWPIACRPTESSHHGHRDFLLVLRLINNGLNQCCDKMMIAFLVVLRYKKYRDCFNYFNYELVYFFIFFSF